MKPENLPYSFFTCHALYKNADAIIAAIIGYLAIYLLTKHGGIGISPDSIVYTSVARNLHEGKGLTEFTGEPVVDFPVFYPIFLSIPLCITGIDVIVFAPVLNGLLFALVIYLCGYIMENFIYYSKWYKRFLLGCIVISPCLLEVYSMLWSETLFIIWSLLFFIAMKYYFRRHSTASLLLVSVIAALAFITRYAGITFIGTGAILLLFDRDSNWTKKLAHWLIFITISSSLVFINLLRNIVTNGQLTGMRQKGIIPFSKNIGYFGSVICDWSAFLRNHYSFTLVIGFIVIIVFFFLFLRNILYYPGYSSYENILIAFFIVYTSFIVISSTLSRYETINSRLLSPAFIPFLLGITYKIPAWTDTIRNKKIKRISVTALLVIGICFFIDQWKADRGNYADINESGIPGYAEDIWKQSPIIQYIQKDTTLFKDSNTVYSNANHAVYLFTGQSVESIPERVHTIEVKEFYTEEKYYLIWFNTDINPDLLNLQEIGRRKKMRLLHSFTDGAIYYCTDDSLTMK